MGEVMSSGGSNPSLAGCLPGAATIEINLRMDGRIDVRSTFMGRQDSVLVPITHNRLAVEVNRLAFELRQQLVDELRRQLALSEAVLFDRPTKEVPGPASIAINLADPDPVGFVDARRPPGGGVAE